MIIQKASIEHLALLLPLFEGYRTFYKQEKNTEGATAFLTDRLILEDSEIFIALSAEGTGIGFTQLYPSFSSVSMQDTFILNDLFVSENFRGTGVGEALLNKAKKFAISENAKGLTLETAIDNPAQKLYEKVGFEKDTHLFHYTWEI